MSTTPTTVSVRHVRSVAETPPPMRPREAFWLLAAVAVAWGINWPVGKAMLAYLPPVWVVAMRSALGTLALLVVCLLSKRLVLPRRGDIPIILSVGILHMTAFSVLCSVGLQYVPAGRSAVLAYTTPLLVAPGAWLLLGEPLSRRCLLGIGLGMAGLALIFNPLAFDWNDRQSVVGNGLVLLAALCWAASILYTRAHKWVTPPFELVFWQALLASTLLLPMAMYLNGIPHVKLDAKFVALLTYGSLFGIALAYWAMTTVNRSLRAATTSLGLLGVPIVGIVCSAAALREAISVSLLGAIAFIIGGIALGTIGNAKPDSAPCRRQTR